METQTLEAAYNAAVDEIEARSKEWDALPDDASEDDVSAARTALDEALEAADRAKQRVDDQKAAQRARERFQKIEEPAEEKRDIKVDEPDMYRRGGPHEFLYDLFRAQILNDPLALRRVSDHHAFEVEKRAMTTTTFGGLIPPAYLLDMYAKALRNGRIFADQVNHKELPATGMSLIVPRLTQGTAAAIQSAENATVDTQDMAETDLTIPVRTVAGYVPVSRQGLERAAYNEEILIEDLGARYDAALDVQCLNGDGTGVNMLGFLHTSGIKTSVATSGSLYIVWQNIADVIQQINSAVGGLGFSADKIVLHPRRWGSFVAAHDTTDRPVLGINGTPYFNVMGEGSSPGYGQVGVIQGLPVYTDANVPTNLGGGDEDNILIYASQIVHLWERPEDPITLAFEQQAGTELSIRLIAYGYAAFSAGRYPDACGAVTGLAPPVFGS